MFDNPCSFKEGVEKMKIAARNITYSLTEFPKYINGHTEFLTQTKRDAAEGVRAVNSIHDKLTSLSLRYGACCRSLNAVFNSHHTKSVMHDQKTEFDNIVKEYKMKAIGTFTPIGKAIDDFTNVLNKHVVSLSTMLNNLLTNKNADHDNVLNAWAGTMENVQTMRNGAKEFINKAICPSSSEFGNKLSVEVGQPGCFGWGRFF